MLEVSSFRRTTTSRSSDTVLHVDASDTFNSFLLNNTRLNKRVHWHPDLVTTPNPSTTSRPTLIYDESHIYEANQPNITGLNKVCTINLSSYELSPAESSLLEKGLTFIPTMHYTDCAQIYELQGRVVRNLKLRDYFDRNTTTDPTPNNPKRDFQIRSNWTPPNGVLSPSTVEAASNIARATERILLPVRTQNGRQAHVFNSTDNLTPDERASIKKLYSNQDIVIKKADKGSATVIMDKSAYIKEAERQLHNPRFYTKISDPIYTENANKIRDIITTMYKEKFLTHREFQYLNPPRQPRRRRFYILPKIHKEKEKWPQENMPEGRPIVSDCNSESHRISRYIDHFLKPISQIHETFIRDTYDFAQKIRDKPLPQEAILVTCDVTALYTNMKLDRILSTVANAFQKHPRIDRPDKYLLQLLEITLRGNDFDFNGQTYLQVCGTAMGKPDAPSQADIYLEEFDRLAKTGFTEHPELLFRFLDDVFFVWLHGTERLLCYQEYLNTLIEGIKVTFNYSTESVNFLDTTVYRRKTEHGDVIGLKVYFKPTDTHQLLHKKSFHPKHTCRGVLKSQFIRFRRISSTREDYLVACQTLLDTLGSRGYSKRLMRRMRTDIWNNYQQDLERDVPQKTVFPLIVPFNSIGTSIAREWREILLQLDCIGNSKVVTAYTVGRSLSKYLIRASLQQRDSNNIYSKNSETKTQNRCMKCTSTRCRACNYLIEAKMVRDKDNSHTFQIIGDISCNTQDLTYVICCQRCKMQYVGETGRTLRERITDHLSNIRTKKSTPVGLHFNLPDHNIRDFRVMGLEHVNRADLNYRRLRECTWQLLLQTSHPYGFNHLKIRHLQPQRNV